MSLPPFLLIQDSPAAAPSSIPWGLILGLVVIFYLMMWRPQRQEQKKRQALLAALKKHDRVLMNSGLYGTVVSLDDTTVTIKVDDSANVRMKFTRSAVAGVVNTDTEKATEEAKSSGAAAPRA